MNWLWLWWEKMMTNEAPSYHARKLRATRKARLDAVVSQPTQQSDVKAKVDPTSPSGISEDKSDKMDESNGPDIRST